MNLLKREMILYTIIMYHIVHRASKINYFGKGICIPHLNFCRISLNRMNLLKREVMTLIFIYTIIKLPKHCMYTTLLEKANLRGTPLIERFLLRLLNSSSIRLCYKYTVQNKTFIKRCASYVGFF